MRRRRRRRVRRAGAPRRPPPLRLLAEGLLDVALLVPVPGAGYAALRLVGQTRMPLRGRGILSPRPVVRPVQEQHDVDRTVLVDLDHDGGAALRDRLRVRITGEGHMNGTADSYLLVTSHVVLLTG